MAATLMRIVRKIRRGYVKLNSPRNPDPPYTHIVQVGDPVLRKKCEKINEDQIFKPYIQETIAVMRSIMWKSSSIGLSAPQIGVPLQIFCMRFPDPSSLDIPAEQIQQMEYEEVPLQFWLNPEISIIDVRQTVLPEHCGSVLGYCADVKRYKRISLHGWDEVGRPKNMEASGWTARIIQHEMDHLNGILYTDIMNCKSLRCPNWQIINLYRGYIEMPYLPK